MALFIIVHTCSCAGVQASSDVVGATMYVITLLSYSLILGTIESSAERHWAEVAWLPSLDTISNDVVPLALQRCKTTTTTTHTYT